MVKKTSPGRPSKTVEISGDLQNGLGQKNKSYGRLKPFKIIGKTKGLGQVGAGPSTWSKKKQAPGRHGTGRDPSKTLGKQRVPTGAPQEIKGPAGGHLGNLTEDWKPSKSLVKQRVGAGPSTWSEKIGHGWSGYRTCNVETSAKQH